MTRKNILTAVVSLGLVAAVSIGGTLAYITATSNEKDNTFTIGDIKIQLDEDDFEPDSKLLPGVLVVKDPKLTMSADSEDAYLKIVAVVPAKLNALLDPVSLVANIAGGWFLESATANTDGDMVYSFYYGDDVDNLTIAYANDVTPPAFTEVMISATADEADYRALVSTDLQINVIGYAIQAEGNTGLTAPWNV